MGINVGCTDKGLLSQTLEGEFPFDNIPEGTEDVQLFNDIYSPLLSGRKFVKKGCTLVLSRRNVHVIKGSTGELIQQIMKKQNKRIAMILSRQSCLMENRPHGKQILMDKQNHHLIS